jgi:D-alanyl-D-alanine carboxypeptidase
MRHMFITFKSNNARTRRLGPGAVALAAAGLVIGAAACSSDDDATATSSPPPTPSAPATTVAPPTTETVTTTASPTTTVTVMTTTPTTTVAPATTAPAAPTTTQPDPARQAMLTGILDAHRAAGEFVGARIALLDADGAITEATAGTQTTDAASPAVDLDTVWNIGSLTKTMVAVVVLQLAEEGRVDLDAGIAQFVPELEGAGQITPRQLLQHTSGLNEYNDKPAVLADRQRPWTPGEVIFVAEAAGRVGEPGAQYHYSNTNYVVLGQIIQQVTGNAWSDEVQARITEPLGMTRTSLLEVATIPGFAVVDGGFADATTVEHPSLGAAAGGMQSNGRDLLRFGKALFDGTLLSPATQAEMQTFVPGDDLSDFGLTHSYGLGLERYESDAVTVLGHLGTGLQGSFLGYDAEHDTLVAVTSNTQNPEATAIMALETLTAIANGV